MAETGLDDRVRASIFAYLDHLRELSGLAVFHSADLRKFTFEGRSVPLIQQRGILKVSWLDAALTIRTTFTTDPSRRPYDDHVGPDEYPRYKWQGSNPGDYDNQALRVAWRAQRPLAWFRGVERGLYLADYPIWTVDEEPDAQQFVLALDPAMRDGWQIDDQLQHPADLVLRRQYAASIVQRRLHQRMFRERVLSAYARTCAICRLRHAELLDAAHIKADSDGGEPVVTNGVAMCVLHHKAFDRDVVGIRPDLVIETRSDVLHEVDGPTLRHALQGVHGTHLIVPRQRAAHPDVSLLEERYERFNAAS